MSVILVTGGAGYVGSHACKAFSQAGWKVISFDNLSRGFREAVRWGPLVEGNLSDRALLKNTIKTYRPDMVAHFAAFAYVEESMSRPEIYYENNVMGTLALLDEMRLGGVKKLIFSSSCASYGRPHYVPIDEDHPQTPISPYGSSKHMAEIIIRDFVQAYDFSSVILRYFNAAGGDPDVEIGERHDPETHVIPRAIAATLDQESFTIFGTDHDTRDGTAIRDYVHVTDLARAHVCAASFLQCNTGLNIFNLGTGTGTTIRELLNSVVAVCGRSINLVNAPARLGDPPSLVATAARAKRLMGWQAEMSSIEYIIETARKWREVSIRDNDVLKRTSEACNTMSR